MLEFIQRGDERGHLVVVEGMQDIPFEIKRVFYIYGSDATVVRGQHANRKSQFVLINVAGTSKVKIWDGLGNEAIFSLTHTHTTGKRLTTSPLLTESKCIILKHV